jgi:hypothetical protein
MAELGKPKWFHKLEPKPTSKHPNGIIGPVQHIRHFHDFGFSNIQKSKIHYETTLVFPIRPSDKILKFSITREYSSFEHEFPGK